MGGVGGLEEVGEEKKRRCFGLKSLFKVVPVNWAHCALLQKANTTNEQEEMEGKDTGCWVRWVTNLYCRSLPLAGSLTRLLD